MHALTGTLGCFDPWPCHGNAHLLIPRAACSCIAAQNTSASPPTGPFPCMPCLPCMAAAATAAQASGAMASRRCAAGGRVIGWAEWGYVARQGVVWCPVRVAAQVLGWLAGCLPACLSASPLFTGSLMTQSTPPPPTYTHTQHPPPPRQVRALKYGTNETFSDLYQKVVVVTGIKPEEVGGGAAGRG